MALDLPEQIGQALREVLEGGWARYIELEDGSQVSTTWHRDGSLEWLQATNRETGHAANFTVRVVVEPYRVPAIGPEDDGALRAELAEHGPEQGRTWGEVLEGDLCQGDDGAWYEVTASAPTRDPHSQVPAQVVTLLIAGEPKTFNFLPATVVRVQRGQPGQAFDNLAAAGLGPEVAR